MKYEKPEIVKIVVEVQKKDTQQQCDHFLENIKKSLEF